MNSHERVKSATSNLKQDRYILKILRYKMTKKRMRAIQMVVYLATLLSWIAQWLFWAGFVNLASEEYWPPSSGRTVAIWIGLSITGEWQATCQSLEVVAKC